MDYRVSSNTLDIFGELIDDIIHEYIKELHSKFLSDMDIQELITIYKGLKKKQYKINISSGNNK